ncbi:DUF1740-domain-containing protein [Annulohypoxylon maeteangense]|uniref:DUF1740-domain-containing protein n=1 Tax=Annulohypoxylon maeteangense TaxID=1927788 RepID=UPI002007E519|nr:DUF1740-domain-containing protein [Annulohypoxylon maeteangense]KAI0881919.1 DUF1740-domain-containing protein [Annulohypoxylon maeteangense]
MSSKQGKSLAVPKFGSFKPKPEPTQIQPNNEDDKPRQHDERHISRKENTRHSLAGKSDQHDSAHTHEISYRPSPSEQAKDGLFIYDKRGDTLIRRYGSINRRDVPNYRRFGSGRILGVDGYMIIDHTKSYDEFFILTHHETRSLLSSDRKTLLAKGHLKSQPIRVRREQSQTVSGSEDFVPLKSSRKRKRAGSEPESSSSEEEQSYRSIHGKSKNHEHYDSDVDYDSDTSTGPRDLELDDPINLKSVELSRAVRDHPEDIDAWFKLVDHQDTLLRVGAQHERHPTTAEVRSFADIKLSMLQQAYSHATTNLQREKLQLRIMREGSKVWDAKVLTKRWDEAFEKHGTSFGLWREHTNFEQTRLSTFQYEKIKKLYVERLRYLESEVSNKESHSDRIQIYEHMIYVFLRATRFISDAGFRDLATAAWQATLELTFSRPSTLTEQSDIGIPSSFQEFWDSEVPRIGEELAQGWAVFEQNSGTQEPPEPKGSDRWSPPNTRDGYKAWSAIEQHKARSATNPARTLDDGAEDDPFRVVMFADIQDILLYLPTEVIPDIQNQLLDAFLIFCQLPPAHCSSNIVLDMVLDDFLIRSSAKLIVTEAAPDLATDSEGQDKKLPEFPHDYQHMVTTPEILFPTPHWFKLMKNIRDDVPTDQYHWISITLKQLVRTFGIRELAPYYLAFESINDPGNEKKTAKALLKQNPSNVVLYRGYSILEWTKGNKDVARNTIAAAMGLTTISPRDKLSLSIAAAWMEIEDHNLAKGTLQLCALSGDNSATAILQNTSASTAQILKTRQFLSSNRDYLLSSGNAEDAIVYAEGLALLEYLTQQSNKEPSGGSQGDIWSAISSISTFSDELIARELGDSSPHEQLLQFAARLLYHYASQGPFRSGFLREQLTKYIKFFPQNTIFLSLFAWREARLSIDDKVRSILDKVVLVEPHDCVSSRVFAIRYESRTGNVHSTRAAFEHALESEVCKNHPGLWISYIRFCHDNKQLRSKAKSVFYRAIQRCPWSKEVFMEAFVTLLRDIDSSELRSVYNTLCEKGLRVHVEMDEFVDKWRREQKEGKGKDRVRR